MKKFVIALTAVAAFTGSALAADLAPHAYKAPAPDGAGLQLDRLLHLRRRRRRPLECGTFTRTRPGGMPFSINQQQGGNGWFGTVGAGYDWQFNSNWVFGIFGDGQFGSLKGTIQDPFFG